MPRVVYVDDEPRLLEITKDFLEIGGEVQVDTLDSPAKVLESIARLNYDVIVSDYQMPGMDGIELLKALRRTGDRTPFILFTGRGREEVAIEALNSGADLYLQKGGDPKVQFGELKNAVIQLTQRKRAEHLAAQAERKYRDLVEGASSIILKVDPSGNIIFLNRFGREFFGTGEEAIGRPVIGTLFRTQDHPDHDLTEQLNGFFSSDKFGDSHTFLAMSGGKEAWVSWTVREVRDTKDRVTEFLAIGNDVTALKNAEMKLQHSTAMLRATLDSSEEGILVVSNEGSISEHNRRFLELWKIPASVMDAGSGNGLMDYAKDQLTDPDLFVDYVNYCYSNPHRDDRRILNFKDGRVYGVYSTPERIGNKVTGRYWSFKDITRQKGFEAGLLKRHENIRGLFVNNPAKMLLLEPEEGRIVHANKAACGFYGYSEDELSRMSLVDITTLPFAEYSDQMKMARTNQKYNFSAPHRLASGEVRDVEIFIAPVTYKGQPMLFSIVQDISGMNSTKRLLEETELKNNRILGCISEGIIAIDVNDRIVYANERASEILLLPMDKLIGLNPIIFIGEESKAALALNLAQRKSGMKGQVDYKLRRRDGSEFWAVVSGNPILTNGAYEGAVYAIKDISERKEAEMEVRRVRHKLELLGDITRHDIQNQVTTIMGNVELGRLPTANLNDRLDRIERAAMMIESHIGFAKDYQELGTAAPIWQGLTGMIQSLDLVKGVEKLEMTDRVRGLDVHADPMLEKVFHNLLENSIKYAGGPAMVTIDCNTADGGVDIL